MAHMSRTHTVMGVDVGIKLHVVIRRILGEGRSRALFISEVDTFAELGDLLRRHDVRYCVLDAQPDFHKAREFAKQWHPTIWLAYYDRQEGDHEWVLGNGAGERTVHINRTLALDEMFDRFHQGVAELPSNARHLGGRIQRGIGEYYREMMALKRSLEQNSQGNWVARYVDERKPDHYAHAETYCMLAGEAKDHAGGRILKPISF